MLGTGKKNKKKALNFFHFARISSSWKFKFFIKKNLREQHANWYREKKKRYCNDNRMSEIDNAPFAIQHQSFSFKIKTFLGFSSFVWRKVILSSKHVEVVNHGS